MRGARVTGFSPRWTCRAGRWRRSGAFIPRAFAPPRTSRSGSPSGTASFGSTRPVEDDSIPSAYLSELDQGLYGGLVGGEVRFLCDPETGWISSMVPPLINDWAEFDNLRLDEDHPWFRRYLEQLEIYVEGAGDRFGLSHFILVDSLNFVFELFGATRTYLELFDHPERVRQAVDFAFALNLKVHETFFDRAPRLAGGTFSNMVEWIPGRVVSESVDPFHMTSVDYLRGSGGGSRSSGSSPGSTAASSTSTPTAGTSCPRCGPSGG